MTRLSLGGAVAVAMISCGGSLPSTDAGGIIVDPPGSPTQLGPGPLPGGRGPEGASQMALSEDYINMIVRYGGVYRMPKYGGEVVTVEQDFASVYTDIAAGRDTVAWSRRAVSSGGIHGAATILKQVGLDAPVVLAELDLPEFFIYSQFSNIQLSASTLYMSTQPVGGSFGVYAVPLDGGDVRLAAPLPGNPDSTPHWLVAEPYIYFITYPADGSVNCSLKRIAIDGGSPEEELMLCPGDRTFEAWLVAIDDTDVFLSWHGEIWKVAKAGGAAIPLYSASDSRLDIPAHTAVLDAQKLYFEIGAPAYPAQIPAKLMSIPKAGGPPTVVYDGSYVGNGVGQLAQDDSNLFMGVASIMLLPKRPAVQ